MNLSAIAFGLLTLVFATLFGNAVYAGVRFMGEGVMSFAVLCFIGSAAMLLITYLVGMCAVEEIQ